MKSKHAGINIFNSAARRFKPEKGYTLIEILIAITILSVGMLALASLQTSGIRTNSTANRMTTRATWAQDRIEKLMAMPYSDPWLEVAGNSGGLDSDDNTHSITSDNYTISWVVANDNPVANAKLITVTVTGYGGTTVLTAIKAQ